ncbi:MAG: DUF4230 domain-containing protein [Bilifractor sp.]
MDQIHTDEEQLRTVVEDAVDASVSRAFKKYGGAGKRRGIGIKGVIVIVVLVLAAVFGLKFYFSWQANHKQVKPVEDHDLTLENTGIFGFKAADFEKPILGLAQQQKLLIVEERDASVNTTITDTGLFNWAIFNKSQLLTIHGTGEYTIDLTEITADDISLDEDTYQVTIRIPHAELHSVVFDPDKTEVGDTSRGWLAFGDIKLTAEQNKEFEAEAVDKLTDSLSAEGPLKQADDFARMQAYETYEPIIEKVSPAYKVKIELQDTSEEAVNASSGSVSASSVAAAS